MSETQDQVFRVTWRSLRPASTGEYLEQREIIAAYFKRDQDLLVFKRADGAITFSVASDLVEAIEPLEDAEVDAPC
jgi:hypothetical protein